MANSDEKKQPKMVQRAMQRGYQAFALRLLSIKRRGFDPNIAPPMLRNSPQRARKDKTAVPC
jgi:hypothetical protein